MRLTSFCLRPVARHHADLVHGAAPRAAWPLPGGCSPYPSRADMVSSASAGENEARRSSPSIIQSGGKFLDVAALVAVAPKDWRLLRPTQMLKGFKASHASWPRARSISNVHAPGGAHQEPEGHMNLARWGRSSTSPRARPPAGAAVPRSTSTIPASSASAGRASSGSISGVPSARRDTCTRRSRRPTRK